MEGEMIPRSGKLRHPVLEHLRKNPIPESFVVIDSYFKFYPAPADKLLALGIKTKTY